MIDETDRVVGPRPDGAAGAGGFDDDALTDLDAERLQELDELRIDRRIEQQGDAAAAHDVAREAAHRLARDAAGQARHHERRAELRERPPAPG